MHIFIITIKRRNIFHVFIFFSVYICYVASGLKQSRSNQYLGRCTSSPASSLLPITASAGEICKHAWCHYNRNPDWFLEASLAQTTYTFPLLHSSPSPPSIPSLSCSPMLHLSSPFTQQWLSSF
ncbi:hypothetical protein CRENBAI_010408 [Crenichthys baileyi]|uniref:Secreted protein n=1 Tax=Crenichthys baileyi TaxID=28760 RepID=A0AAV9QUC7_9TELE